MKKICQQSGFQKLGYGRRVPLQVKTGWGPVSRHRTTLQDVEHVSVSLTCHHCRTCPPARSAKRALNSPISSYINDYVTRKIWVRSLLYLKSVSHFRVHVFFASCKLRSQRERPGLIFHTQLQPVDSERWLMIHFCGGATS